MSEPGDSSNDANSSNPDSLSQTTSGLGEKRNLENSNSSPAEINDDDLLAEINRIDEEQKEDDEKLKAEFTADNARKEKRMAKKKRLEEKIKNKVRRKNPKNFTGGFSSFLKHRFKNN